MNERARTIFRVGATASEGAIWEDVRDVELHEVLRGATRDAGGRTAARGAASRTGRCTLRVHASPLALSAGETGAVLVFQDTTALRRLERIRQEFVANVSHELKTPLAVIKLAAETLQDGAIDDPENREMFFQQINEQADRLHALILDLLSLARIESGEEAFDWEAVPLEEVVQHCLERHRGRAEGRRQTLASVAPTDAAAVIAWADEEAIGTILDNLLDNAIKYTPEGGTIRVRWWLESGQACFEVQDTGIGIPERDLPRIFERFYRVDKARSRELGGTGLGLSIVKHLVQAHRRRASDRERARGRHDGARRAARRRPGSRRAGAAADPGVEHERGGRCDQRRWTLGRASRRHRDEGAHAPRARGARRRRGRAATGVSQRDVAVSHHARDRRAAGAPRDPRQRGFRSRDGQLLRHEGDPARRPSAPRRCGTPPPPPVGATADALLAQDARGP